MDANAWSLGCCSKEVCDSLHGLVMFKATADELRACADDMNRWLAEGQLNPQIGKTLPLSETAALTSISLTRLTREHVTLPACTAMRIAIGQLWQETNTLTPIVTARTDFELFGVCRGEQLVEQMATTKAGRFHPIVESLAGASGNCRIGSNGCLAQWSGDQRGVPMVAVIDA